MKFVWMILALIIAIGVAYLIWDEFIAKRERSQGESDAERYIEADIKAIADETRPLGHPSDAEAAAALHSAVDEAEASLAAAEAQILAATDEAIDVAAETVAETADEAVAAVEETADEIVEAAADASVAAAEAAADADDAATAAAEEVVEAVETRAAAVEVDVTPDNLTRIKGIGKVYQQRLNDAGIYRFAQVAEMDAAQLAEITSAIDAADIDDWKRQARALLG